MMVKRKERLAEFREQRETHLKSEKRPFKPGGTKLPIERQKRCVQWLHNMYVYDTVLYHQPVLCCSINVYLYIRTVRVL